MEYGNITLGKRNKFFVTALGESMFYSYCEEFKNKGELEYHSLEAFKKHIGRLQREKDSDFAALFPDKKSITGITIKILKKLQDEYDLSPFLSDAIREYAEYMYYSFTDMEAPLEATYILFKHFFFITYKDYCKNTLEYIPSPQYNDFIPRLFTSAKEKYKIAFEEIAKNTRFGSKEKFYGELDQNSETDADYFKQIIANCVKDAKNPTWNNMKQILDFLKKSGDDDLQTWAGWLIEAYITSNIEKFMKEETEIPREQIEKIYKCRDFIKTPFEESQLKELENYIEKEDVLSEQDKEKFDTAALKIMDAMKAIFIDRIYLVDKNQTKLFLEEAKAAAPEASQFYCQWLEAYIELAKGNVLGAKNKYKKAFENRRFAGNYFEAFIKQAFALSAYDSFAPKKVHNSIDPRGESTTPLSSEAKKYWNYGYATGIFEKPDNDTYLESFNRVENFFTAFPSDMFFENSKIKEKLHSDFMGKILDKPIEECIEADYEKLLSLNETNINKRVRMFGSTAAPLIPPISLSLYHCSQSKDCRFLDLVKNWLGLSGESSEIENLDVNVVSDRGVTPLNAATALYKLLRFHEPKLNDKELNMMADFKKVIFKIIEKSKPEYLNVESKKSKRHPLQEAIESYDLDIVKAIIEKGLNINGLKISADACSPVYYTLMRIKSLKKPRETQNSLFNHGIDSNTNWNNLNVSGITVGDKQNSFLNMQKTVKNFGPEFMKLTMLENFGDESTYEVQREKLKEICIFFISKTANQDEFILRNEMVGQSWTSLYFAAETDDADICRELLKKGANPNLHLGYSQEEIPITFLITCIGFCSWNVLEMFLTEFKDLAQNSINEYVNPAQFTPLTFFLTRMLEERKRKSTQYTGFAFVNKIAELFKSCGADFNIPSIYGSANDLLERFKFL